MCIITYVHMYTTTNTKPKHTKKPQTPSTHFDFSIFFSFVREKIHKKIPKNRKPPVRISIFRNFFPYKRKALTRTASSKIRGKNENSR